ncbi:MAG: pyridoxamine 5'-phosphate oxidase family protein [Alphaproteobacteria bacterium]|nr:pyridoxamine 5'-phosphate oxidase family protein [Alphaproteobacteria bacterium]
MLTEEMKKLISEHSAGMVATINEDGTPSVSPKATFVILDDRTIAFGNLRSPGTIANIGNKPSTEVCFIDVLARKAVRVSGTARYLRNAGMSETLKAAFAEKWSDYMSKFGGVVEISITGTELLLSPAYDLGLTEPELREANLAHLQRLS